MAVYLRKRKLKSGAYRVYLDLYHNGNRWTEFPENLIYKKDTKKEILALAEKLVARRQLELAHNDTGFTPIHKRKSNFVDFFPEVIAKRGLQSQGAWKAVYKYLKAFTGGRIAFSAIDQTWMEMFQSFLLERVGQNSANLYLGLTKSALKEAVNKKIIGKNPIESFSFAKQTEVSKVYLVSEEIEKLVQADCPDSELKRAFLFSCFTGLRLSDIESLTWEMVQVDKGETKIHFRQKKTKGFEYIPLNDSAIRFLNGAGSRKTIAFQKGLIFSLTNRSANRKRLQNWVKLAGINKPITFHSGRHTYATLSLSSGVPIALVQRLLGHRDIKSTSVYAKVTDQAMNEAIKKIPNLKAG